MGESEIVAAYPDLEPADVRAVISRYLPRRNRDHNFAVAGNFERIDPTLGRFRRFPTRTMIGVR